MSPIHCDSLLSFWNIILLSFENVRATYPLNCLAQYEEHVTYRDPESLEEIPLVPGMSRTDNMLRWGFIKKVITS